MDDCVFCMIKDKKIPANIVYEDDTVLAFKDIKPVAPVHVLIIPKVHIDSVLQIDSTNAQVLVDIHLAAKKVAELTGVAQSGFRLINNCGEGAGQTVRHLHYHLIAGTELSEKLI